MTETVQLFSTCLIDTLYPHIGRDIVTVLNRCGVRVEMPAGQTCCGQPAYNAGMWSQARPVAVHTLDLFEKKSGPVVVPSGSCTAMIRHGYQELFAADSTLLNRAKSLAERTYEFTEFLVDYLGVIDLGARFPGKITYHSSCHLLRDLGIDHQPRLLLSAVRETDLVELPFSDECCGFGGVFSVEHPEISAAMLQRKIDNLASSEAPVVVSCDAGCITNINGGLHRQEKKQKGLYIAEILARQ